MGGGLSGRYKGPVWPQACNSNNKEIVNKMLLVFMLQTIKWEPEYSTACFVKESMAAGAFYNP